MALKEASLEPLDLDVDLSQVDTSYPVLPSGLRDLRIHDLKKEENKAKTGYNIVVTFATVDPAVTIQDKPVEPGFPLTAWYPLQPSEKSTDPDLWKKNLAMLIDAATGSEQGNRPKFSKEILLNQTVRANIKVENDENGRPRNSIGNLTHPES